MEKFRAIDSHCHIYPDSIVHKAVKSIEEFYDNHYHAFDGTVTTMLKNGEAAGIEAYVIFSVATSPHQVSSINHFISDAVSASDGKFFGLGTLHPDSENVCEDFAELLSLGLRGVKLHPDIQKIAVDDERYKRIYRLCSGKCPVLIHLGDYRYDFSGPERFRNILEEFPECIFIGAHFGGWSVWEKATEMLSSYPNLYVDTSSSLVDIPTETATALIEKYTADRVIFGTDYPLGDSKKEVELLRKAVTNESDLKKIMFENASKLFGIS